MDIDFSEQKTQLNTLLYSLYHWIPLGAVIINKHGQIIDLNKHALSLFAIENYTEFTNGSNYIDQYTVGLQPIREILPKLDGPTSDCVLIRLQNRIIPFNLYTCIIPDTENRLVLLTDTTTNKELFLTGLINNTFRDIQKLRPFLNKAGKEKLNHICNINNISGDIYSNSDIHINSEKAKLIKAKFDFFTDKEVSLSVYLSMQLSINEIALLCNCSTNSLRVMLHRMVHKTGYDSTKAFISSIIDL